MGFSSPGNSKKMKQQDLEYFNYICIISLTGKNLLTLFQGGNYFEISFTKQNSNFLSSSWNFDTKETKFWYSNTALANLIPIPVMEQGLFLVGSSQVSPHYKFLKSDVEIAISHFLIWLHEKVSYVF